MAEEPTSDLRIRSFEALEAPASLVARIPAGTEARECVRSTRHGVEAILDGRDDRLLAITGPCSIHDPAAAMEYARMLAGYADAHRDRLQVVMRVYFEKPRTRLGWKGLILDPGMDGSNRIPDGLVQARQILRDINALGLGCAVEALDPIVPQYLADLVSWAAIGARTTESQTHREMASGLSMPVGFKNSTDGSVDVAVNAMASAASPHSFLGMDPSGRTCVVHTDGNPWGHVILRGGNKGPNYHRESVEDARDQMEKAGLPARILVDCSHANSRKDFRNQGQVLEEVVRLRREGLDCVKGFMLESNLHEGRQDIPADLSTLRYGVSVTDACIGWDETLRLLDLAAGARRG